MNQQPKVYLAQKGESLFNLAYYLQIPAAVMLYWNPHIWNPMHMENGEQVVVPGNLIPAYPTHR